METDFHNIPDYLFDWIQSHSYDSLDSAKQKEALQYFTAESYNDMHEAIREVKQSRAHIYPNRKNAIKQNLLQEFDAVNTVSSTKRNLLLYPVELWKVAATLVFLASAALWLAKDRPYSGERNLIAQADTVYITKQVLMQPQKIYDTVFITEKSRPKSPANLHRHVGETKTEKLLHITSLPHNTEFVTGIDALHNKANMTKKNNMKNDSIRNDIGFVTL